MSSNKRASRQSPRQSPRRRSATSPARGRSSGNDALSAKEVAAVRKEVQSQVRSISRSRSRSRGPSRASRGSFSGVRRHSSHHHHHGILTQLGFIPRADATMEYLTSILGGLGIASNLWGDACTRILAQLGITVSADPLAELLKEIRTAAIGSAPIAGMFSSTSTPSTLTMNGLKVETSRGIGGISSLLGGGIGGVDLSSLAGVDVDGMSTILGGLGLGGLGGLGGLDGLGGLGGIAIKEDSKGRFYICPKRRQQIYFTVDYDGDFIPIKVRSDGRQYFRGPANNFHRFYL